MAITKLTHDANITSSDDSAKIRFICPVCKSEKTLHVPKSVIIKAKNLTTMSIAKGLVCNHQFQAYVDKNCAVRGYQRVDFEFENTLTREKKSIPKNFNRNDKNLFENLILEGNYLEYRPKYANQNNFEINDQVKEENQCQSKISKPKDNKMSLQEIYDEFWEFIDDDNKVFKDFIIKDLRRSRIL